MLLCSIDSELNFYDVAVSNPINLMKKWLVASASILPSVSGEEIDQKRCLLLIFTMNNLIHYLAILAVLCQ